MLRDIKVTKKKKRKGEKVFEKRGMANVMRRDAYFCTRVPILYSQLMLTNQIFDLTCSMNKSETYSCVVVSNLFFFF